MGCMNIFMRPVTGDWVTFNDFASPGNMPHGNNYGSINMYARDMVCISRDLNDNGNILIYKTGGQ